MNGKKNDTSRVNVNFVIKIPTEKIKDFAEVKGVDYEDLIENLEIRIPEIIDNYIQRNTDFFLQEAYYDIK